MIRVILDVDEIDYQAIADKYLESKKNKDNNAGSTLGKLKYVAISKAANLAIDKTSEAGKIDLANKYLESHKDKILEKVEGLAKENGIAIKIRDVKIENKIEEIIEDIDVEL